MQHCSSTSLYKVCSLFPETLCLLGDQSWFYSCIYKGLCFYVTCNYHYLVLPFTKLLIIISIKCQAFSPVKHILSPRMYVLHGKKCILYLYACTSIHKPLPQLGSTLGQTAFCIHSIFPTPTHWLPLPFLFFKNLLFLLQNTMIEFSHLFLNLSVVKVPVKF